MQDSSDVSLLSVEVERALKALGMVSHSQRRTDDIQAAVEHLRRSETQSSNGSTRLRVRERTIAPDLIPSEDDVVIL